jgi:hypothetical protein
MHDSACFLGVRQRRSQAVEWEGREQWRDERDDIESELSQVGKLHHRSIMPNVVPHFVHDPT